MSAPASTRLLVAVINDPEKLDEILSGFVELGITGATIVNSEGMGRLLSHDIPIFAGLRTLISGSRPQNRTILSVVPEEKVGPAIDLLQEVAGNLDAPATGIVFTIPVDRVVGLAPELGDEGSPI
jgi:nitrogen regulatory protein PII